MIEVSHLSKSFGAAVAVDDISFEVAEGENLVLLGTSGCGKTTTLRMINHLVKPTSGSIKIGGKDIATTNPDALRRGIGYMLQHNSLFPHYTIRENIAIVPKLLGWEAGKIESRTRELLHQLHLQESELGKYPAQLSGGQQQRVNIARALAADPPILLMDEPFGALDTITRASIRKDFAGEDAFMRKTIVMVTHDVQEAFDIADKICLMDKGKIMQIGKPAELLFKPANDFVKAFFADGYLQLAMRSVKVGDIWGRVHETTAPKTNKELAFGHADTLWDMMERITAADYQNDETIVIKHSQAEKQVQWGAIMNAFTEYKAQ